MKTLEKVNKLFFLFFTSNSIVPNVLSAPSQYLFLFFFLPFGLNDLNQLAGNAAKEIFHLTQM